MSLALILACLWVVAATCVAMLPMRLQYFLGVTLLLAALVLIAVIFVQHGAMLGAIALFGFVSMFRRPLRHFWRRAWGMPADDGPDAEKAK